VLILVEIGVSPIAGKATLHLQRLIRLAVRPNLLA
jgi:hypothetical protein